MREIVKVRMVAGSLVISLPQSVLEPVGLKEGDRVIVEAAPPRRLIVTKEGKTMTSAQHLEMEIDVLEKKKTAMESDLRYKELQYDKNMPCDEGMSEPDVAILVMYGLVRDRDSLDVDIAEKRMQLYEIQASADPQPAEKSSAVDVVPTEQVEEAAKIEMARFAPRSPELGPSPIEEAWRFKLLLDADVPRIEIRKRYPRAGGRKGNSVAQPASNAVINMYVSFLEFPAAIQEKIHDGRLTVKGANELTKSMPEMWASVLKRAEADCLAKRKKSVGDQEIKKADAHFKDEAS